MDRKFKFKIINALRKLTFSYPERSIAKKRAKIGPELYKCELCSSQIYTGKRPIEKINEAYPEAIVGKIQMDHTEPFVELSGESDDWNVILSRMFPVSSGWQTLCSICHDTKTAWENSERQRLRKEKKYKK